MNKVYDNIFSLKGTLNPSIGYLILPVFKILNVSSQPIYSNYMINKIDIEQKFPLSNPSVLEDQQYSKNEDVLNHFVYNLYLL